MSANGRSTNEPSDELWRSSRAMCHIVSLLRLQIYRTRARLWTAEGYRHRERGGGRVDQRDKSRVRWHNSSRSAISLGAAFKWKSEEVPRRPQTARERSSTRSWSWLLETNGEIAHRVFGQRKEAKSSKKSKWTLLSEFCIAEYRKNPMEYTIF